jgi:uncharacterized protein YcsI (UPF0317 family)
MQWLRMIPSDEARKTHRGIRRYFEIQGEPIVLSQSSENEEIGLEEFDKHEEGSDHYSAEEGELDIFEGGVYGNHE